jgi:hypothetical protein
MCGPFHESSQSRRPSAQQSRASRDHPIEGVALEAHQDRRARLSRADGADEVQRPFHQVAVLIEADVSEDVVFDRRAPKLPGHRRARAVGAGDRVEQDLGRLRALRRRATESVLLPGRPRTARGTSPPRAGARRRARRTRRGTSPWQPGPAALTNPSGIMKPSLAMSGTSGPRAARRSRSNSPSLRS